MPNNPRARVRHESDSHGNRFSQRGPSRLSRVQVRKVPASSVRYGEQISQNGKTVWIAVDGERVLCAAATADAARLKGADILSREQLERAEKRRAAELGA